jgi:hypothetical protein
MHGCPVAEWAAAACLALSGADAGALAEGAHAHEHAHERPMAMTGALGPYAMSRDASGTAWQPDATPHHMGHLQRGGWLLSGHALLNGVYDDQRGPRGDDLAFLAGMTMGTARRDFADGDALTLRAMLSPDPFMGKRGYPLLLAAGETADGATPLVDRQHPHELVMELSATRAWRLGEGRSAFVYAALPGEPAFGPPSFMHRASAMMSPEAPITHHWLDSTHITFGVLTAGWVMDRWKLEASRFTGREPDENRYDLERPRLDSTSVRASWNPAERWSLQASWAGLESPEQLHPDVDEDRLSASVIYAAPVGEGGTWSTTLAWGYKDPSEGESTDALALEAAVSPNADWTLFARAEAIETHELGEHDEVHDVAKLSLGAMRFFPIAESLRLGLGALYTFNSLPGELETSYGGSPNGAMIFLQLSAGS